MTTNLNFTDQGNRLLRQIDELIDKVKSNQFNLSDVKQISNNVDIVRKRFKKIIDSFLSKGIITETIKPYAKRNFFGWWSLYRYPSILSMNTFVSELSNVRIKRQENNKNKVELTLKDLKRKVEFGNNNQSHGNIKVEYNNVNMQFRPLINQKLQPGNKNFINGKLPMNTDRYNRILSVIQNIKKKTN